MASVDIEHHQKQGIHVLSSKIERNRLRLSKSIEADKKSQFGQFLLIELGMWAMAQEALSQSMIDTKLSALSA